MKNIVLFLLFVLASLLSAGAQDSRHASPDSGPRPVVAVPDSVVMTAGDLTNLTIHFDKVAVGSVSVTISSSSSYVTVPSTMTLTNGNSSISLPVSASSASPGHTATLTISTADGSANRDIEVFPLL